MKKKNIIDRIALGVFVTSILIIFYSLNEIRYSKKEIKDNLQTWDSIKKNEIVKVNTVSLESRATDKLNNKLKNEEEKQIKKKFIGKLTIEKTHENIPILEGTSEEILKIGAGKYEECVLPEENGNCIIFGHRDGVFSNLKEVKVKDRIIIETINHSFVYEVTNIKIIDPDKKDIIKSSRYPMITLVTCYPFGYIGAAPQRFVVEAIRVNVF